ncbi:hypothetical protein BJY04DRAFT_178627 [Aspergillus karnatakaensis]|uniref:uncharacterized protein n=1 Tax=Aspergillus karnatakaensis TaxID=1810916 RepID=UPI003CCD0ECC
MRTMSCILSRCNILGRAMAFAASFEVTWADLVVEMSASPRGWTLCLERTLFAPPLGFAQDSALRHGGRLGLELIWQIRRPTLGGGKGPCTYSVGIRS